MNLALNLGIPQSVHSLVSQNPTTYNNTKEYNNFFALNEIMINSQKSDVAFEGKFSSSSIAVDKTRINSRRQVLVDILSDCADKRSLDSTESVHGFVLKSKFSDSDVLVLLNHVAHAYVKCMDFVAARQVFDEMPERNIFSYTVMISGYTEKGSFHDGFELFNEMVGLGILPDKFAYSSILQTCIGLDCADLGKMVHAQIFKSGFSSQSFVSVSLLNMYAKLGSIKDSYKVFGDIVEHNQVSWNAMISGYTLNGLHSEAYNLFLEMKDGEIRPNAYTIISVSKAVGKLRDIDKGRVIHNHASELGLDSTVPIGTALIDMYSKCESLSEARSIFDANFAKTKSNPPWNAMISGYSRCSRTQEAALVLFAAMRENGVPPDVYTYCSVLNAIAALKRSRLAKEVHGTALKSGSDLEISVSNAIADAYAKCGLLEEVRSVFDGMVDRDVVSWTTLVAACSQRSEYSEALVEFSKMRGEGFVPNHFTLSTALDACAGLSSLDCGRQLHGLACKTMTGPDVFTEGSLIDMYSKCGLVADALAVFERISDPDTVSWTAIISGYAQHGLAGGALELFKRMERSGAEANSVTLLCVLFACSHTGMVEEGLRYFRQIPAPEMEHYACVVDLFGRVGRLSEAAEFIRNMPIEPNEIVWQTLLGACRVHGNVELGRIAAEKILAIRPEDSAAYVLLSNTYMETGSYEVGVGLRHLMKDKGVRKEAGCSWISVRGEVHRFYAGDQLSPRKDDRVYAKLRELSDAIKSADYLPDLSYE